MVEQIGLLRTRLENIDLIKKPAQITTKPLSTEASKDVTISAGPSAVGGASGKAATASSTTAATTSRGAAGGKAAGQQMTMSLVRLSPNIFLCGARLSEQQLQEARSKYGVDVVVDLVPHDESEYSGAMGKHAKKLGMQLIGFQTNRENSTDLQKAMHHIDVFFSKRAMGTMDANRTYLFVDTADLQRARLMALLTIAKFNSREQEQLWFVRELKLLPTDRRTVCTSYMQKLQPASSTQQAQAQERGGGMASGTGKMTTTTTAKRGI